MTDILVSQLLPASFRGVQFLVRSETSPELGRKIILHEYLNSSERFVEDIGQLPPRFQIEAFISGQNFRSQSAALEAALNQSGTGRLVLPTFGSFDAYALPYSKRAGQTSVGEITFTLEFAVGRPGAGPSIAAATLQTVFDRGDVLREAVGDAFEGIYEASKNVFSSSEFQTNLGDITNRIGNTFSGIVPSEFSSAISSSALFVSRNLSLFASSGSRIALQLFAGTTEAPGIWQNVSLGLSQTGGGLSQLSSYFDVASNVVLLPETTGYRRVLNANNKALYGAIAVSALAGAYEVAAQTDYLSTNEIESTRSSLDDAYENMFRRSGAGGIEQVSGVRSAMQDVRLASLAILDEKDQTTPNVVTSKSQSQVTSLVQAYRLYAEDFTKTSELQKKAVELRNLNPENPSINFSGSFEAFSNV